MDTNVKRSFFRGWMRGLFWMSLFFALSSRTAAAQDAPKAAFQLQQFRPFADPEGVFQTQSAKTLGQWNYLVSLNFNYAKDPLTFRLDERRFSVVGHQLGADLVGGIGFLSWLDVMIALPMTLYQSGAIPAEAEYFGKDAGRNVSGFALSDLKIAIKAQALREKQHFLDLGILLSWGMPTNYPKNQFNGEEPISFGFSILASKRISIVDLAFNLGYRFQPRTEILNLTVWHELTYSLAAAFRVLENKLDILADFAGSTALAGQVSAETAPFDFYIGARYYPLPYKDLALTLGFGIPILPGYGSPQFRVLLGASWAPKDHDQDKDGILDHLDRCPNTPGPRENQGCPWPDTDGDGLTDNIDKCPKIPGPRENNGCPWPDTDKDGLTDNIDKCPTVPGPKENNGCPWPDTDKDGLTDNIDKCPDIPGPKENHGCPDTDQDGDGVVDRLDKCPYLPADKKGQDGCPKDVYLEVKGKLIVQLQKVAFYGKGTGLTRPSYRVLQQLASMLHANPNLRIQILSHTDNRGAKRRNLSLTTRRAENIRRYLLRQRLKKKKLDPQRIQILALGAERPLDTNRTKKGRERNNRIELKILPP